MIINNKTNANLIMTHIHYNTTTAYIDTTYLGSLDTSAITYEQWENIGLFPTGGNTYIHTINKPVLSQKIPGWMHIDPINTLIDLLSVADLLSDYKFTPGFKVTVEDLVNPAPLDYEATPANI